MNTGKRPKVIIIDKLSIGGMASLVTTYGIETGLTDRARARFEAQLGESIEDQSGCSAGDVAEGYRLSPGSIRGLSQ